jgi:hypothetical protein
MHARTEGIETSEQAPTLALETESPAPMHARTEGIETRIRLNEERETIGVARTDARPH